MLEISDQLRRHAAWVDDQMGPLTLPTDPSVSTGPAESAGESPNPIDRAAVVPRHVARLDGRRRVSRQVWVAVAAAALLAVLVASLLALRSRPDRPGATGPASRPASELSGLVATGHDSVLLPRSTPDGMLAVDVTTDAPTGRAQPGLEPTGPVVTQLFGVGDEARLAVRVEPSRTGSVQDGGVDQAVRGLPGKFMVAGQPGSITTSDRTASYFRQDTANDRYSWYERGAFITASFRNLTPPEALQIVDAMQWTSTGGTDGFVLSGDAGLVSLLEPTLERTTGLGLEADVDYLLAPDDATALKLVTCPAGTGTCPGAALDYPTAWLNGSRASDGSVTASIDGMTPEGGLRTHGFFIEITPSGATAQVDFGEGRPADPDLARRLLADLEVTGQAGLDRLHGEISSGLSALPVLAATDLPGGRVEAHGAGRVSVTCLVPTGGPSTCGVPWVAGADGRAPTMPSNVSAMVDGHWILAASSTNPGTIGFASGDAIDDNHPAGPPLPGQAAAVTAGATTYQFGLVEVPDGVTGIVLTQTTSDSIGGGSVERPAS